MKLLLCGPSVGIPNSNVPAFKEAYERLILHGHQIEPVKGEDILIPKLLQEQMRGYLAKMLEADGIVLLPGWGRSEISKTTVAAALSIGLPCYSYFSHRPSIIEKMAHVRIITRAENIDERLERPGEVE